jgi:putative FmdB family regulatory protein
MPIYEYRCERCGEFEEMQRITDPPLERCPTCKRRVRRLISSTSFQLKGSGWYVTDYARSGNGKGKGKDKDASASKDSGGTETKTESKAESKSETKSDAKPSASGDKAGS